MFQIVKHAQGNRGAFVNLVRLDSDDYTVIVRFPADARLHHSYIGPDWTKAEEVFRSEESKLEVLDKED